MAGAVSAISPADPRTPTLARRIAILLLIASAAALFWLQHIDYPETVSKGELDTSWQQVKGYELRHGLQVGVDTVFTYGPLGYFNQAPYDSALFWPKVLLWEGALEISLAVFFALAAWRLRSNLDRLLLFAGLAGVVPSVDSYYFLSILALGAFLLARPARAIGWQALACVPLSLIALDKFTYLLYVALAIALATAAIALEERRAAWRLLACFVAVFSLTWMLLGQSLANVPRYLATSWEILGGYNEAMSLEGSQLEARLAIALFTIAALAVALELARGALLPTRLASAALALAGLYLAGKAGFVRHSTNSVTFFAFAGPATALMLPPAGNALRGGRTLACASRTLRAAAVAGGIYGCATVAGLLPGHPEDLWRGPWNAVKANVAVLAELEGLRDTRERERHYWAQLLDLPKMRARIGDATVDAMSNNQGRLLINGFRYHPRPVFQSYSAYTPELAALNAEFYASERGPRFVIFGFETCDGRMPSLEDGAALQELLRHYRPVLSECGLLLFERRTRAEVPAPLREVLLSRTAKMGEQVDLGPEAGRCRLLSIRMRRTALGRLRSMACKASDVRIDVELTDGTRATHRFIPGMAETGFLVTPYFDSEARWVEWSCGADVPGTRSFRITLSEGAEHDYEEEFELELVRADELVPELDRATIEALRWSMLVTVPDEVVSARPPRRIQQRLREALVVEPPSYLRYCLGAGRYRLSGRYGIALQAIEAHCTEGARFSVSTRDASGRVSVLLERELEVAREKDRGLQALEIEFVLDAQGDLFLRSELRSGESSGCNWTCWSAVEIVRVGDSP